MPNTKLFASPNDGWVPEVNAPTEPKAALDIQIGDTVKYTPAPDAKLFKEALTGIVTRVGDPFESGVVNVDLSVPIVCRHCYDKDLGHGNHEQCCHCSPEQKRNTTAPTHEVKTVPGEGCEVSFRPRRKAYKTSEMMELLEASPTADHVSLHGRTPEAVACLSRHENNEWRVTLPEMPSDPFIYQVKTPRPGWSADTAEPQRKAIVLANTYLFGEPLEIGEMYTEFINQGDRDCYILDIKRTRYRIEFEMPNCTQEAWRTGIRIGDGLYIPVSAGGSR